ncbi:YeaH/YhbH family protein [Klebsiella pneumoniae]|nr:YeaH/YhbH family protein [Klebsiella pneumoniae]
MAKRFYILLYLFLSRTYKNVDVSARQEVDEHDSSIVRKPAAPLSPAPLKLMDGAGPL